MRGLRRRHPGPMSTGTTSSTRPLVAPVRDAVGP